MNTKKLYNDLYWGLLFLAISMDFNIVVYGVSVKIVGLFLMRRGLKGFNQINPVPEFGMAIKGCEIGMIFWAVMIAYKSAIMYMGIPGPVFNVLAYSIGWAVVQALIIINLFKGIQKYIRADIYQNKIMMLAGFIGLVCAMGCFVVLGVPMMSTIRMVAEIAMALMMIKQLNRSQFQLMDR